MPAETWWPRLLPALLGLYAMVLCLFPSNLDAIKIAIALMIAWGHWRGRLRKHFFVDPACGAILLFCLITVMGNALGGGKISASLQILAWLGPFFLGKAYAQTHPDKLSAALVWGATGLGAYMFGALALPWLGIHSIGSITLDAHDLTLTFRNMTRTALYLAVACQICVHALLFLQSARLRQLAGTMAPVLFTALIVSGKRMTLTALLVTSALTLAYRKKFLALSVGLAVTLGLIVLLGQTQRFDLHPDRLLSSQGVIERQTVWYAAWELFKENPLIGCGFKSFKEKAKPHVDAYRATHPKLGAYENLEDAHNFTMHLLAESGILGLATLLFLFVFSAYSAWMHRTDNPAALSLAGCILLSILHLQLHMHLYSTNVYGLIMLLMGFVQGIANQERLVLSNTPA